MLITQRASRGMFSVPSPDLSIPPSEISKAVLEGMKRALVVHGCEGLDELSIAGPSKVANRDGAHKRWEVNALDRWFTHSGLIFPSRNPSHIDVLWCFMIVNPQKIDYYIDSEYASPTNAIVKRRVYSFFLAIWVPCQSVRSTMASWVDLWYTQQKWGFLRACCTTLVCRCRIFFWSDLWIQFFFLLHIWRIDCSPTTFNEWFTWSRWTVSKRNLLFLLIFRWTSR